MIKYIYICKNRPTLVSDTNGFINSLNSVHGDTRSETQFLKVYANHTMLNPPQTQLCLLQRSNTQLHLSTAEIQLTLFQNPHLFWAWRHPQSSLIFCLGVFYDKWWLSYPLCASGKLCQMTQGLTKLNDKIWLTKND